MKIDPTRPTIGQELLNDLLAVGCPRLLITEFCDISSRNLSEIRKGHDSPQNIPRLVGLTALVSLLKNKKLRDAFRELLNNLDQEDVSDDN